MSNYQNQLENLEEKIQEVQEAYDEIMRQREPGRRIFLRKFFLWREFLQ